MQNKWYSNNLKLGMVGGGQLGRMFIQEAINFDLHVHVLDGDINAPCKQIAHTFTHGSITDFDTLLQFGLDKDVLTVEIENVSIEALEELEKFGKKVFPQPRVLRIIKDKGIQKQFYKDNNIPTAPFRLLKENESIENHSDFLPMVQKLCTGGYDGKGVQIIRNSQDFEKRFSQDSVLEQMIPFQKELSVIVARNERGEMKTFPVVECEFNPEANLVEFLFSPAEIDTKIELKAHELAQTIIEKLDMVGLLAVEMFLLENGELLVNEIAPRPHNSGHHTIECNTTSQFEQHLRSILNLPLGATDTIQAGAMINLLGEKGFEGPTFYQGMEQILPLSGVHIHLYGKGQTKPMRKMGHVTICGNDLNEVKKRALFVKDTLKVITE